MSLIRVQNLHKHFSLSSGLGKNLVVKAVDGVSFELEKGEVLALVGESGCGKSTLALTLMHLEEASAGQVLFNDNDITTLKGKALKNLRRDIQMVFQDPYESLNPLMTVGAIVEEPLKVHGLGKSKSARQEMVKKALEDAGLNPAESYLNRRPHELSGGQRQRVVIAAALVLEPSLVIADEPVSMLDVSIRAEVLGVLERLKLEHSVAMLFITHDLGTAAHFADRIAVMYLGRIVELGETQDVLENPQHPYTKALLSVIPVPNPKLRRKHIILQGDPPNPINIPGGCRFHPRCPVAIPTCSKQEVALKHININHKAACLLLDHSA
ncbi:MAG: ABC transporter ATP-binding protein [Trueperaceae bacterium]|nr:ABC transporter ATP-binding protein [Trueperaceae bacterium]